VTEVRKCTIRDLDFLVEKAYEFNSRHFDVPLCPAKLKSYLRGLIVSNYGVVLRTDTGAITGVLVSDPVRDWNVLVETAWYTRGRDGLKLLRAFEKKGKRWGVDEIRMTTLEANQQAGRILSRRGYKPIETSHRLLL